MPVAGDHMGGGDLVAAGEADRQTAEPGVGDEPGAQQADRLGAAVDDDQMAAEDPRGNRSE